MLLDWSEDVEKILKVWELGSDIKENNLVTLLSTWGAIDIETGEVVIIPLGSTVFLVKRYDGFNDNSTIFLHNHRRYITDDQTKRDWSCFG